MPESDTQRRAGAWFIGARGSVATTARVGAAAVAAGLAPPVGLVTALPPFRRVWLPLLDEVAFGGHDVSHTPLTKRAEELSTAGVLPSALLPAIADSLGETDRQICTGLATSGGRPRDAVERAKADIAAFRARHDLDVVVVVNLTPAEATTEDLPPDLASSDFEARLDDPAGSVPPGVLGAYAAFESGCPFVDFTPSVATSMPAVTERATDRGLAFAGRDGKTGETLVKTALAPMFADRNLRVLSWAGTNLLGGSDGASLADPARANSKLTSKRQGLASILGTEPAGPLHIDYVPDLGEWKTAWDHVSFEGFLGTRMTLQFTWQGCDSALAAPLVLDLVRLTAAASLAGETGALGALGYFFKDPVGTSEHAIERQFRDLCEWVATLPETDAEDADA